MTLVRIEFTNGEVCYINPDYVVVLDEYGDGCTEVMLAQEDSVRLEKPIDEVARLLSV